MNKDTEVTYWVIMVVIECFLFYWAYLAFFERGNNIEGLLVLLLIEIRHLNARQRWLNATFKKFSTNKLFP
jgi:hypothetical protein